MTVNIESVRANNPLESVVQRFTGLVPERHKILAPWRDERTPSVHIYDNGKFHDYGGDGWHGDVIDFVGYYLFGHNYDPDVHFLEVVDRLGALDVRPLPQAPARPKPQPAPLNTDLQAIHRWHDTMPAIRRGYWYTRGLTDSTIDKYLLGWDGKRYTIPCLYRNIPFGIKRRQSEVDDGIDYKYVMTTGSRAGLYNADILWETGSVVICEGEIDCLLLNQYGYPAVSSTAGANTFKPQWAHLFSHVRQIWLLYDNDEAGMRGMMKTHATLRRAKIVRLPQAVKDIGELFENYMLPCRWLDEVLV